MKRKERIKWTFEKAKEAALKCEKLVEFNKKYSWCYKVCLKNGWLNDFTWLKRREPAKPKTTLEDIFKANNERIETVYAYFFKKEKKVYVGLTVDLHKRDLAHRCASNRSAVYVYSSKNDIKIPDVTILEEKLSPRDAAIKEGYYCQKFEKEGWTLLNKAPTGISSSSLGVLRCSKFRYENCYKDAKQYEFVEDYKKGNPKSYRRSYENGYLEKFTWLKKKNNCDYNYNYCFNIALKYDYRAEFRQKERKVYIISIIHNWIEDYTWMEKYYCHTLRYCKNRAKLFSSMYEFSIKSKLTYERALKNNWLKDLEFNEKKENNYISSIFFYCPFPF